MAKGALDDTTAIGNVNCASVGGRLVSRCQLVCWAPGAVRDSCARRVLAHGDRDAYSARAFFAVMFCTQWMHTWAHARLHQLGMISRCSNVGLVGLIEMVVP